MIEPYIYLNGNCAEAIDFYEQVFDGQDKRVMFFKDMPQNPDYPVPEELKELVMHAEMLINGTKVNFSDIQNKVVAGNMISLAVRFTNPDLVVETFLQLKQGGEVLKALGKQFFSPMYGWVKDKYGISWQLICEQLVRCS